jgi:hypothetical protein
VPATLARGCSNSYVTIGAPELWPEVARDFYARYERHYWQRRLGAVGFREFPAGRAGGDWYMDVDAGPVVAGFGFAASAFGVGAARINARFDHAHPLFAQMLAILWPLPDGTLGGARLLSSATDAPYLGEAAILYIMTRQPHPSATPVASRGGLTPFVWILLAIYFGGGVLLLLSSLRRWRWARRGHSAGLRAPRLRLALLALLALAGGVGLALDALVLSLALLLGAGLVMPGLPLRGRDYQSPKSKPSKSKPPPTSPPSSSVP